MMKKFKRIENFFYWNLLALQEFEYCCQMIGFLFKVWESQDLRDYNSATPKSLCSASPCLSESFTWRCPDTLLCVFFFFLLSPENCILPKLSGSCIPKACNQLSVHTTWSSHGLLCWQKPFLLPRRFLWQKLSRNVWLMLPAQGRILAVSGGTQSGWGQG